MKRIQWGNGGTWAKVLTTLTVVALCIIAWVLYSLVFLAVAVAVAVIGTYTVIKLDSPDPRSKFSGVWKKLDHVVARVKKLTK